MDLSRQGPGRLTARSFMPKSTRHFAIQNAVDVCGSFHLSAEAEPFDIEAQIGTYERAIVWIVVIKGKWKLSGGPLPENGQPDSRAQYFDQCAVIVNAFTGNPLRLQALPLQSDTNE
jgi:hypothetical protein